MSDTPETQEAVERWRQGKINIFDEMARLETERNKERKVSEKRRTLLIYFMEAVDKLEDECDKARKWAKRWKERAYYYRIDCAGTLAERDNLLQVVQVRRRERDEAREDAKAADEHRRLAERLAEAAMFERDQYKRMWEESRMETVEDAK